MFRKRREPIITAESETDRICRELRNLRSAVNALREDKPIVFTDRMGKFIKHYDARGNGVTIERIS